jgi:hypothetical protein
MMKLTPERFLAQFLLIVAVRQTSGMVITWNTRVFSRKHQFGSFALWGSIRAAVKVRVTT